MLNVVLGICLALTDPNDAGFRYENNMKRRGIEFHPISLQVRPVLSTKDRVACFRDSVSLNARLSGCMGIKRFCVYPGRRLRIYQTKGHVYTCHVPTAVVYAPVFFMLGVWG